MSTAASATVQPETAGQRASLRISSAEALVERRRRVLEADRFPMKFLALDNLALDYLLSRLIEDQRSNIQAAEQCKAELVEDPQAWSLASDVPGSERVPLDILNEFLPCAEPVLNGDESRSRPA